jgi:putative membrane protein
MPDLNKTGVIDMDSMVRDGFLRDVSSSGQMERELSQLALTKSSNADVKQLAQQVVQDHQKFADELAAAASVHDTSLPKGPSGHFRKNEKKLQALTGSAFDQAYLKQMNHDVKGDEKEAKQAGHSMDTVALRKFALDVQTAAENRLHQIDDVAKSANLAIK